MADLRIAAALSQWVEATSSNTACNRTLVEESLTHLRTGPGVDRRENLDTAPVLAVKLSVSSTDTSDATVWNCDAHLEDVPADGNCGFHAFSRAAECFKGGTATRLLLPTSADETRALLVDFLQSKRPEIEHEMIHSLGQRFAENVLWWDIGGSARRDQHNTQVSFDDLCESIPKSGIQGHWLGSCLGEFEQHLLARALNVTMHCVSAAVDKLDTNVFLRQTQSPHMALWSGRLSGEPVGAVVLRFMGMSQSGHYQIVRCGKRRKRGSVLLYQSPSVVTSTEGLGKITRDVGQDVRAFASMHGVQPDTQKRYKKDYALVSKVFTKLTEEGTDPTDLATNGATVVKKLMEILMERCGPKELNYQGRKASSTGNVILASAAKWYNDHGVSFTANHTCVVKGKSVTGPPWKAQQLLQFKDALDKAQAKGRSIPIKWAYQLTHDDVAAAMRQYVARQLGDALNPNFLPGTNPLVDWMSLQTTLMVVASFGCGCRGAELVSIRLDDIVFFSKGPDCAIGVTIYGAKAKKAGRSVRRIVFPSWKETTTINPSLAILMQLSLVHGIHGVAEIGCSSYLLPNIQRNQVQRGQPMPPDTYSTNVKQVFQSLGITGSATEHSPRRGASGFRYYILGENPDYIRDFLGHASVADTFTYIGFHDKNNSYVSQGYGTCGAKSLR